MAILEKRWLAIMLLFIVNIVLIMYVINYTINLQVQLPYPSCEWVECVEDTDCEIGQTCINNVCITPTATGGGGGGAPSQPVTGEIPGITVDFNYYTYLFLAIVGSIKVYALYLFIH